MKKVAIALLGLSLSMVLVGCGSSRKNMSPESTMVKKDGVMSAWANWVKDKGDKYDIQFVMKNESEKGILVMLGSVQCFRGTTSGMIKHTFFNTGERYMDFQPGETKAFNLVCRYGFDTKGDYRIVIGDVFENTVQDGRTAGKSLAKKIEWKMSDN